MYRQLLLFPVSATEGGGATSGLGLKKKLGEEDAGKNEWKVNGQSNGGNGNSKHLKEKGAPYPTIILGEGGWETKVSFESTKATEESTVIKSCLAKGYEEGENPGKVYSSHKSLRHPDVPLGKVFCNSEEVWGFREVYGLRGGQFR